jgi:iron complex transport system substrate-binding protein
MKLLVCLVALLLMQVVKPLSVKDDYGREITLSATPERVVSIAPSVTEMVFAIGAGEKLVGVDSESDFPVGAKSVRKVGSYISPSIEMIVALNPDLLIVSDLTPPQIVNAIEARGINVFVVAPKNIDGIAESMRNLGMVLGVQKQAELAAKSFEERVLAVEKKAALIEEKPKVYLEYFPYWTFGPGSFGNDLIEKAGGLNIGRKLKSPYAEVSNEFVVVENPDVIIITKGKHSSTTISSVIERPGWKSTNAVKNNSIYYIDDSIVSRPGPRMVDALEALYSILH